MAKKVTQKDEVLKHLKRRGYITPSIAANTYNIWRLAAVVYDLREMGNDISTLIKEDAKGHKYARYELAGAI